MKPFQPSGRYADRNGKAVSPPNPRGAQRIRTKGTNVMGTEKKRLRQERKTRRKLSSTTILYSLMLLLIVYLAVFRLPWFFPDRITAISGFISNISVEEGSVLNTRRGFLSFRLDDSAYYFTLNDIIRLEDMDPLVSALQACEADQVPITIEVTSEKDYRDWPLSMGRGHAISLSYGNQSISSDAYRKNVTMLRIVLLAFALLLTVPMLFLWRLDRKT